MKRAILWFWLVSMAGVLADELPDAWKTGDFAWKTEAPVLKPRDVDGISAYSMKDPSIVREGDRWHLFCTMRGKPRSHCVVYCSFKDWAEAETAERHVLPMHPGFFCAPQVFYFTPEKKWYLLCQASDPSWKPEYQTAFATTETIADPRSWSKLRPMFGRQPPGVKAWLDFWIICDESRAFLFFTSLDGKMWRSETKLSSFPKDGPIP